MDAKETGAIGAAAPGGEHAENFGSLMRHKPVAFDRDLAILTDGHRAGAKYRLPDRSHSAPRRQSDTEGAAESVGTSVLGSRVVP